MDADKNKLVLFHLEAAEPSLIEKWCSEGKLPTIEKIRQDGVYGRLDPPGYIDSGCVWPTFSTGTNPGKHGIGFYPRQIQSGTYHIIKKYAEDMAGKHFWNLLSDDGKNLLVLDMPLTYPTDDFKGSIVCNWGDEHASHPASSKPAQLIETIIDRFGQNELNNWYQNNLLSKEEWKELGDTIYNAIKLRTDVIKYLVDQEEWDCAVLNFGEIHWAGHMCWHLHDKSHPQYDQDLAEYTGNIILKSYQELDRSLGEIIKKIPSDSNIMLLSSLGMGAQVGGEMLLNEILQKLNLLPDSKGKAEDTVISKFKDKLLPGKLGMTNAIQQTEKIFSPKLMMRAKAIIPTKTWDKWTRRFLDLGNNRAKSIAFQLPGDHSGLIRINLKGREPKGKVDPKDYDQVCQSITDDLLTLIDPSDGSRIVKEVVKIKDKISGPLVDEMPDLAVIWREGRPITKIYSEKTGKIENTKFHKRSGGHINNGFLIAKGPSFQKGIHIETHDLLDVAPTVLHILGSPIPNIMDGEVIFESFNKSPSSE